MTDDPKLIDFDAFVDEAAGATIPYRVGGVIYQAPATLSAAIVFDALRLKRRGVETVERDVFYQLAAEVLGDSFEPMMRASHLSIPRLQHIVETIIGAQTGRASPPPNRKARRSKTPRPRSISSTVGRSSRRTSNGNTASISGPSSPA